MTEAWATMSQLVADLGVAILIGVGVVSLVLQIVALRRSSQLGSRIASPLESFQRDIDRVDRGVRDEIDDFRREFGDAARAQRKESREAMESFGRSTLRAISAVSTTQKGQLDTFANQLATLTTQSEQKAEALRGAVEQKLEQLRADNGTKLEQMRQTVDEKLQGTLEKRLGESFTQVSKRLEEVHKGLGEMQSLASGVGDLKRMMTNVKTRGIWGEYQLGAILEQILSPEQYERNVATKGDSNERVEFAVRLPGSGDDPSAVVYLPIDAKFPSEDYQRLLDAHDVADAEAVATAGKQLEGAIKVCAKDIRDKYLAPPRTTDFAIMFLPTEGLYAEVVRRTALVDFCQRECRVVVAGPTTLAALLNSLQMGFRTLAIQKRSSEVWEVLGAVKTEFGKFGTVLAKIKRKLQEASDTVEKAETRTRAMDRKLRAVESLPGESAAVLLGLTQNGDGGIIVGADDVDSVLEP